MRGIVQYEVYVLTDGRWSVHSRYPGAQRDAAIRDASDTENLTGHATKVVRDTYFPETNQNEEVTTYLSPKARMLRAITTARKTMSVATRRDRFAKKTKPRTAKPDVKPRRMAPRSPLETSVRMIVAVGSSVVMATILTALVLSSILQIPALVERLPPGMQTTILSTTYIVAFLIAFPRAYRANWRVHRMLLEMWENKPKPKMEPHEKPRPRRAADGFRPWDVIRSEPAPAPPPTLEPPLSVTEAVAAVMELPPPQPQPVEVIPPPPVLTPVAAKEEAVVPPPPAPQIPARPTGDELKLERIVLRRFVIDVLLPTVVIAHRDDPVTRRGIALVLAGAVTGLSETSQVSAAGTMGLLSELLTLTGSKPASVESFLSNYSANIAAPNAQSLLTAGRKAIISYVEGKRDVARGIQDALALWRFPSITRPQPPETYYYLLSEASGLAEEDTDTPRLTSLHDDTARALVIQRSGEVIPQSGKGIFARFTTEGDAAAVADAIRAEMAVHEGPPVTATVISHVRGPHDDDDPAIPLQQARARLVETGPNEMPPNEPDFEAAPGSPPSAPVLSATTPEPLPPSGNRAAG